MSNLHPLIDQACAALHTKPSAGEIKILDGMLHDAIKRMRGVPPLFEHFVIETIVRTLGLTLTDLVTKAAIETIRPTVASLRVAKIKAGLEEDVAESVTD